MEKTVPQADQADTNRQGKWNCRPKGDNKRSCNGKNNIKIGASVYFAEYLSRKTRLPLYDCIKYSADNTLRRKSKQVIKQKPGGNLQK